MHLESPTQLPPTGRWRRQSPAQPPPLGSPAATLPVDCVVGTGTGVCQGQEAEQLGKELGACWGGGGWVGCSFVSNWAARLEQRWTQSDKTYTCCCRPSYLHFPQADGRSQLHFCAQLSSRPSCHTQQPTCSGVKCSRHYRHVWQYARDRGLRHHDGQGAERREGCQQPEGGGGLQGACVCLHGMAHISQRKYIRRIKVSTSLSANRMLIFPGGQART